MGKEYELINAVREGNVQYVRKAHHKFKRSSKKSSSKKSTINVADTEGFTALHHAALLGDVEIIMSIIEMEGDVNTRDKKGMTPLHMAAWAGKDQAIKALLESRALPNLPSLAGETALHLASQHGYAACAKVLLVSHGDGTFRNSALETPLDLACQYGHTGVIKQLLQNEPVIQSLVSPSTDPRYKSPLHLAAKGGHDDIVKLLLNAGANVNECRTEGTALHLAGLYGKKEVVRLLIVSGINISLKNKEGMTALDVVTQFTASRAGLEIKQMLREAAGESLVYARAVSDYNNKYDETCLNFQSGDSIAVLEQNEDGRWRGYVVNSENEKMGYFPAMAVHLLSSPSKSTKAMSVSSMASSNSSESTSRTVQTPNMSPERKNTTNEPASPATTPVGIVPIGNFEVLTLSQGDQEFNQPPKQTAAGSLPPRMSSFKQKRQDGNGPLKSPRSPTKSPRKSPSHKYPAPPPPPERSLSHDSQQNHVNGRETQRSFSDEPPPSSHRFEGERPPQRAMTINPQMMGGRNVPRQRTSSGGQEGVKENEDFRGRTQSAGRDFSKTLKMAIGSRVERDKQTSKHLKAPVSPNQLQQNSGGANYAEIEFATADKSSPTIRSPRIDDNQNDKDAKGEYTTVYFSDESDRGRVNSSNQKQTFNNRDALNSQTSYHGHIEVETKSSIQQNNTRNSLRTKNDEQPNYEPMELKQRTDSYKFRPIVPGYEDMNTEFSSANTSHSTPPPELPSKGPQLPMKRVNTLPTHRQQTSDQRQSDIPRFQPPPPPTSSTSLKSRERSVYENSEIKTFGTPRTNSTGSAGSISPSARSPNRLPNAFPVLLQTPNSPNGRTSPSDLRASKTEQEVFDWLTELKLACYFDSFKKHGFDMASMQAITPDDLNFLEIHKTGHRKKLLSEIARLSFSERLPNNKPRDVGTWLGLLNLRQYEPNFVEGGFDDMDFIKDLDKNDLEMIDIKKRGHQKKLLLAVQRLNDLELTAVLDIAVLESPTKRAHSFRKTRENSNKSSTPEPSPLPTQITEDSNVFTFPASPQTDSQNHQQQTSRDSHAEQSTLHLRNSYLDQEPDIAVVETVTQNQNSFTEATHFQENTISKSINYQQQSSYTDDSDMSTAALSPRAPPPLASKPAKPAPTPKPKPAVPPPVAARKPSVGPSVKPKPKPPVKPPQDQAVPSSPASKVTSGEMQGSQEEVVRSSKSRDFFKQVEKKVLDDNNSPTNSLERRRSSSSSASWNDRRSSHSSTGSISPTGTIIKKKPVPAPTPKPKPVVEEKPQPLPPQPHVDPLYPPAMLAAQAPPVAAKKAPPPAPPKRINSQISENVTLPGVSPASSQPEINAKPVATVAPQPPPPEEEICFSPPMPAFIPPPPPTEEFVPEPLDDLPPPPSPLDLPAPPPEVLMAPDEIEPPKEVETPAAPVVQQTTTTTTTATTGTVVNDDINDIDKAFKNTDDIMSNLLADLDDFSSQIDDMF
ncbi:caskin-2-like [Clytia hemisphaerica]|uniref:Uncharacterized protein n=1 Tax=Clytia hemisphaerica TaxID=252671 RepID=A0A7M5XGU4_9CNID